jgi:anti-anti-sigma regulatory factor
MAIQKWSESVILVNIDSESQVDEELQWVKKVASKNVNCDIIMRFPLVTTISQPSLIELVRLQRSLALSGHRLIISSASSKTKRLFSLAGLDNLFEITTDLHDSLSKLQKTSQNLD